MGQSSRVWRCQRSAAASGARARCHHVRDGRVKTYAEAMHEIMMEKDGVRQTFLDDVDAFFAEKTGV